MEDSKQPIKALVAEILDDYRLVINKGKNDGIRNGIEFKIYEYKRDIIDPETNEFLEKLYIHKGIGVVIQAQNKIAVIRSTESVGSTLLYLAFALKGQEIPVRTFTGVEIGDIAEEIIKSDSITSVNKNIINAADKDIKQICENKTSNKET